MSNQKLPEYIASLLHPDAFDHAVEHIELIETHISWVILTGTYAYKIKKPVNLGFLDFSTLEKRHFYCQEELRLNSRLAPSIYLDVISISSVEGKFAFSATGNISAIGNIIEYAVKMVQFPQQMQMDRLLASGHLYNKHINALAKTIAEFHQHTAIACKNNSFGNPEKIYSPVQENFIQLQPLIKDNKAITLLAKIEHWSQTRFKQLKPLFIERKKNGFIRECHGDLHTRNLVFMHDIPVAFDCIEFDPALRWIDTISDAAFLIMDLQYRQQADFAWGFLNRYLEITGDYAAVKILNFYLLYRAMVRTKVAAISASQMPCHSSGWHKANTALYNHLKLADSYLQPARPRLIISCGLSASGKTTLTQPLLEKLTAIRLRSDVERKRLFEQTAETDCSSAFNAGIYTPEATRQTYQYLAEQAELILKAGYSVIIDAAFLKYEQRQLFHQLAQRLQIPFVILQFKARPDTLRQRIISREQGASDADLSVLEQQLYDWKPLQDSEQAHVIEVDTESPVDSESLISKITACQEH